MPNDDKTTQTSIDAESDQGGKHGKGGGKNAGFDIRAEMAALRAEMADEFKKELAAIRAQDAESFRERMNEEREVHHAQLDAARADAAAARATVTGQRIDVPRAVGGLGPDETMTPAQRRASRPLPLEGEATFELTHGSFLGDTMDRKFRHTENLEENISGPARPGEVLRFDMKLPAHRKQAQQLRDSGCAERV